MSEIYQPSQQSETVIPNFIANNPDSLAAYMRGVEKADAYLEHPEQQVLPNPAPIPTEREKVLGQVAAMKARGPSESLFPGNPRPSRAQMEIDALKVKK